MNEINWFNVIAWSLVSFCCGMSWYYSVKALKAAKESVEAANEAARIIEEVIEESRDLF